MAQEVHSFWTDIKKYEDILLNDPKSLCFAQLSELYRKSGLLDDAVDVAKRGIEAHPDYVGGHLSLGRAYFDKGQKADSRDVLERVVRLTPENYIAQKLLSQIYLEQNNVELAEKTLQTVLALNPDDVECRLSLEALSRSSVSMAVSPSWCEDEEDLEDAEIVEDDLPALEGWGGEPPSAPDDEDTGSDAAGPIRDPLTTATLAEIYLAQGFHDQALKIYRELSVAAPGNDEVLRRIAEIELKKAESLSPPAGPETAAPSTCAEPPVVLTEATSPSHPFTETGLESHQDRVVATLEQWLESIERRRACH